jgi:hypothetical protein
MMELELCKIYQKATEAQKLGLSETSYIGSDGKKVTLKMDRLWWWEGKY